jgi:hypothetical protein
MTPSLHGRCQLPDRPQVGGRSPVPIKDSRYPAWSFYGAKPAQPVATSGKSDDPKNRSNKPIGNRWQLTATVPQRMVKSMFATACHRLPTVPYLLERESTSWLRKEIESREPEGPQDSFRTLTATACPGPALGGLSFVRLAGRGFGRARAARQLGLLQRPPFRDQGWQPDSV